MKCPACTEGSIEDDVDCGKVCKSCGYLPQEELFAGDMQLEGTSIVNQSRNYVNFNVKHLPMHLKSHNSISISKGKEVALESVSSISSYLRLPSVIKEEITEFVTEMVDSEYFKLDRLPKKISLVACCTYIVLRRHYYPISIAKICNFLQCYCRNFSKTFSAVLQLKKISVITPTIDELVEPTLNNLKLGDEMSAIVSVVINILYTAHDCWIVSGRIIPPYIIAAGFIAWKSRSYERRKCSFSNFCKRTCVTEHLVTARHRLKELSLFLKKLAEELPWRKKENVDIKDVPYMLDSILKHSEMLCSNLIQSEGDDEKSKNIKKYQAFRIQEKRLEKRRKVDYDSDDSCCSNFDDDLLNCYIRTEKEVADIERFLKEKNNMVKNHAL